jgi:hypothetical protein
LRELVQYLLKHCGGVVLAGAAAFRANSRKCPFDGAAARSVEFAKGQFANGQFVVVINHGTAPCCGGLLRAVAVSGLCAAANGLTVTRVTQSNQATVIFQTRPLGVETGRTDRLMQRLQLVQTFAAAVVSDSQNPTAAARLIDYLSSDSDRLLAAIKRAGMERPRA